MKKAERRRRVLVLALLGAAAAAASTSSLWGSYLSRKIAWLEVERVEVSGVRLLAPHEVLAASGIRQGQHLLDERELWEEALRKHPVIEDARVSRRAPNTLRIRIAEKRPIAFVADGTLRPATGAGELLPIDPSRVVIDLPIVRGSMADSTGVAELTRLLAETDRLRTLDPVLMTQISEIRTDPGDPDVLLMTHTLGEVLLPMGATGERTAELRSVIADVQRRLAPETDSGRGHRARFDLRFGDQIVVRPTPATELS
ncbi:MAG: FtsQ-type POTRA domain-containing protein [Gemmatimonadota bacterium]